MLAALVAAASLLPTTTVLVDDRKTPADLADAARAAVLHGHADVVHENADVVAKCGIRDARCIATAAGTDDAIVIARVVDVEGRGAFIWLARAAGGGSEAAKFIADG